MGEGGNEVRVRLFWIYSENKLMKVDGLLVVTKCEVGVSYGCGYLRFGGIKLVGQGVV